MPRLPLSLILCLVAACNDGATAVTVTTVEGPIQGALIDSVAVESPVPEPAREPEVVSAGPVAPEPDDSAASETDPTTAAPDHAFTSQAPSDLADDERFLTFEDIAWPEYEPPELREVEDEMLTLTDFPERLQSLNGSRARIDGYMVPVDFEERMVTSFILSRYLPGCCFGVMPMMDEWIEVEVQIEGGVEYYPFQVVRIQGEFEVGEVLDDYGYVRSIYRIKADIVDEQL